jgi:hypothetical protein
MKKLFVSMVLVLVAAFGLSACGDRKFTADEVASITTGAANQAAQSAKQAAVAEMDAKWIRARNELRQMGATTATTGKFLIADNCNVKPDGFTQLQANKDFPSSAFGEFRAGCTSKVVAMKAERAQGKHEGAVAEQKRQQKVAALKECSHKLTQKERNLCRAEAKRHA